MARPKKEISAKKQRLQEKSKRIGEPENIFDIEAKEEEQVADTSAAVVAPVQEEVAEEEVKALPKVPRTRGKKYKQAKSLVDTKKTYTLEDAVALVKKASYTSFDGTVELHLTLADKEQRYTISLPHGSGKKVKVAALVPESKVQEAVDAGAAVAGAENFIADVQANKVVPGRDFTVLVADPTMMAKLAPLARVLGPKGLMPNPKTGTVGPNIAQLVGNFMKGQQTVKAETPNPYLIHLGVGKVSFDTNNIVENINFVFDTVGKNKVRKAVVSVTMGPGITVSL